MFRKSSNNPFIQGNYLNAAYNDNLGGPETVGQRYPGLLGQTVVVGNSDALKLSDSSIGTLYEGVYQLVKFTTAITRGQLVFWGTLANNGINDFEVGSTVTATTMFRAGVALRTDSSASGKYGWIQVAGLASMLYGTVTDATIGNGVYQTSATAATVDALADAGADATALSRKRFVGIAYATPASDTVARVLMNLGGFYPVIGN